MSKTEFLERLERALAGVSLEERVAALQYYTEYFAEAGPEGEEEALSHLGAPEDIAASIGGAPAGAPQGPRYTARPEEKPAGGAAGDEWPVLTLTPVSPVFDQTPPRAPEPPPFEGGRPFESTGAPKPPPFRPNIHLPKDLGPLKTVLIIIALVFLAPAIFGLACGALGVAAGLLVCLCVLPFIGLVLAVSGVVATVVGCMLMAGAAGLPTGLVMLGLGLFCMAAGLLVIWGGIRLLRAAIRGFIRLIRTGWRKLFPRRPQQGASL